jgi:hypothetical protein
MELGGGPICLALDMSEPTLQRRKIFRRRNLLSFGDIVTASLKKRGAHTSNIPVVVLADIHLFIYGESRSLLPRATELQPRF